MKHISLHGCAELRLTPAAHLALAKAALVTKSKEILKFSNLVTPRKSWEHPSKRSIMIFKKKTDDRCECTHSTTGKMT